MEIKTEHRLPLQVAVYAITPANENGSRRVLLLRRKPDRNRFWQGVTGGVEAGESEPEAARREFREETGQDIEFDSPSLHRHIFTLAPGFWHYYSKDKRITETVYHVVTPEFVPHLSAEHDAWGWVEPQAALQMLHWPENRESLRRILNMLELESDTNGQKGRS
jgi:dihydroneopterin triphosphate diphosphatase